MKENERPLSAILAGELAALFSEIKREFWSKLFEDVLKKHSFQNDFYLRGKRLSRQETVDHLRNSVIELCQKYNLQFSESNGPVRTELKIKLSFNDYKKTLFNELSIVICKNDITLRILPFYPFLKMFWIEEYVLVEKILEELCLNLYDLKNTGFEEINDEYLKVRAGARKLTIKTVEIARNSISAIYCSHITKNRYMHQYKLYSNLYINGKYVRIFHQDFLENPEVLMKEFNNF